MGPKDHRYFRVFTQARSRSPTQRLGLKNIRDNGSDGQPLFLCFYTNRVQGPGSRVKNHGSRVQGHAHRKTGTETVVDTDRATNTDTDTGTFKWFEE